PAIDPMRVAYVSADAGVPVFGRKGCSVHVQEFLRALLRQGADVQLYASRFGGEAPAGLEALPAFQIPLAGHGHVTKREQASLAANHELLRALDQHGPFDLVYERYSLFSYSAMEYARGIHAPGVLEVNAPLIQEQAEYRTLIDRAGAEWAARRVFE